MEEEGKTVVILSVDGVPAALIAIADTIKESSREAVAQLKRLGVDVYMITGDNKRTAAAVGRQVEIGRAHV